MFVIHKSRPFRQYFQRYFLGKPNVENKSGAIVCIIFGYALLKPRGEDFHERSGKKMCQSYLKGFRGHRPLSGYSFFCFLSFRRKPHAEERGETKPYIFFSLFNSFRCVLFRTFAFCVLRRIGLYCSVNCVCVCARTVCVCVYSVFGFCVCTNSNKGV